MFQFLQNKMACIPSDYLRSYCLNNCHSNGKSFFHHLKTTFWSFEKLFLLEIFAQMFEDIKGHFGKKEIDNENPLRIRFNLRVRL